MNQAFQDARGRREDEFWSRVKTMKLEGDKLVLTTKPK